MEETDLDIKKTPVKSEIKLKLENQKMNKSKSKREREVFHPRFRSLRDNIY